MPERTYPHYELHERVSDVISLLGIIQIRFTVPGDTSHSRALLAQAPQLTKGIIITIRPVFKGFFSDTGEIGQFSLARARTAQNSGENAEHVRKNYPHNEDICLFNDGAMKGTPFVNLTKFIRRVDKFSPRCKYVYRVYNLQANAAGRRPAMLEHIIKNKSAGRK